MKIKKDYYQIRLARELEMDKRIVAFSDIHYGNLYLLFYQTFMKEFYRDIISCYKNNNLNAILIPGDLLFYISTYLDTKYFEYLKKDLKNLSQTLSVPICISYGNHDFPLKEGASNKLDLAMNLDNRQEGIYVLNNEQIFFDNLCITGFSPIRDAYSTFAMPNPGLNMAYETF